MSNSNESVIVFFCSFSFVIIDFYSFVVYCFFFRFLFVKQVGLLINLCLFVVDVEIFFIKIVLKVRFGVGGDGLVGKMFVFR